MMKRLLLLLLLAVVCVLAKKDKDVTSLQIGVKHRPKECNRRAKVGDTLKVSY